MVSLYSAFSLIIRSHIPLPELPAGHGSEDVSVRVATIDGAPAPSASWVINARPGDVHGWAPGVGAFRVRSGREILIDLIKDADERAVRLAIVGPFLGVILAQRGHLVLHASTVAIGGRAVSFFGQSGQGKSTLTAALTLAGHRLVADDLTVIDTRHVPPRIRPGFPRIKLWPDSVSALEQDVAALPLIHPERSKRSLQLQEFAREPVPMVRCYQLQAGREISIEPLAGSIGVLALVQSTYQSYWMADAGMTADNLIQCGALARSGVLRVLTRPKHFAELPSLIAAIEADVGAASELPGSP